MQRPKIMQSAVNLRATCSVDFSKMTKRHPQRVCRVCESEWLSWPLKNHLKKSLGGSRIDLPPISSKFHKLGLCSPLIPYRSSVDMMGYSAAAILAIICIGVADATNSGTTVQGWLLPSSWNKGTDYVVVLTSAKSPSQYGGYIWPGPDGTNAGISYSSPDGYQCEAKVNHLPPRSSLIVCVVALRSQLWHLRDTRVCQQVD